MFARVTFSSLYPYSQKFEGAKTLDNSKFFERQYPYSQKFEGAKTSAIFTIW